MSREASEDRSRTESRFPGWEHSIRGRLAFAQNDLPAASREFRRALDVIRNLDQDALQCNTRAELARVHLAMGDSAAALAETRRATDIHRKHKLAPIQAMLVTLVWWVHSRALRANGEDVAARAALKTAYDFMKRGVARLSDEGLRRNYHNKIEWHRGIIADWLDDARARRPASARRTTHLAGASSLREPFERLVDSGVRLNELRSAAELHEFLIDEATELSGAERVLLMLEAPEGLQLAVRSCPPARTRPR
jgi:hypothetical protein